MGHKLEKVKGLQNLTTRPIRKHAFFFFLMWTIFKVFIEFVTILLLFFNAF